MIRDPSDRPTLRLDRKDRSARLDRKATQDLKAISDQLVRTVPLGLPELPEPLAPKATKVTLALSDLKA